MSAEGGCRTPGPSRRRQPRCHGARQQPAGVTELEVAAYMEKELAKLGAEPREYFIHRTGHGLGLEVHEEPYIVGSNHRPLGAGTEWRPQSDPVPAQPHEVTCEGPPRRSGLSISEGGDYGLTGSFTRYGLAEGVNLYVQPSGKFKTTVVYVYFHMPLAEDTVTRNALLPMVLSRGSRDYPTTAQLSRHLDELYGASFGADVARRGEVHSVVFRIEVANEQHIPGENGLLAKGLDTLASVVTRPLADNGEFKAEYVQQESANLKQIIEGMINDKRRYSLVRCTEAMCKGEPFALYRLGRVEDLQTITPRSLLDHHQRMVSTAPVDILVIGDVNVDAVCDMVQRSFVLPPAGPQGRVMPTTKVKESPGRPVQDVVDRLDVNQGVLVIGFRTGTTIRDEDYFPMLVANGVLGGFPHSKLFQQVREKNSLAYYAYSAVETLKGLGFMYAGIEFEHMAKCKEIMIEQVKALQDGQISDEELQTTVSALVNDILSAADSPGAMADLAVDRVFSGRDISIEDRVAAYKSVTKEQVAAVAQKFALDTVYFLNKKEGGE